MLQKYKIIILIIQTYYIFVQTGMSEDPKKKIDTIMLWRYCLQQGLVVGAFTIDYFGRLSRLAAVNMLLVITDYSELSLIDIVVSFKFFSY